MEDFIELDFNINKGDLKNLLDEGYSHTAEEIQEYLEKGK